MLHRTLLLVANCVSYFETVDLYEENFREKVAVVGFEPSPDSNSRPTVQCSTPLNHALILLQNLHTLVLYALVL